MNDLIPRYSREIGLDGTTADITYTGDDVIIEGLGLTLTWRTGVEVSARDDLEDLTTEIHKLIPVLEREITRANFVESVQHARLVGLLMHYRAGGFDTYEMHNALVEEAEEAGRILADRTLANLLASHGWAERVEGKLPELPQMMPHSFDRSLLTDLRTGMTAKITHTKEPEQKRTSTVTLASEVEETPNWVWVDDDGQEVPEDRREGWWWKGGGHDLKLPFNTYELAARFR